MAKIIIVHKDMSSEVIEAADIIAVSVEGGGMLTEVRPPQRTELGQTQGSVYVNVAHNELADPNNPPEVFYTIGDKEGTMWNTITSARVYGTYNGRIMGVNNTLGFGSTEKPLATKPWVRGQS